MLFIVIYCAGYGTISIKATCCITKWKSKHSRCVGILSFLVPSWVEWNDYDASLPWCPKLNVMVSARHAGFRACDAVCEVGRVSANERAMGIGDSQ